MWYLLVALSIGQVVSSSSTSQSCLSRHDAHRLNSELESLNHKWNDFIGTLVSGASSVGDKSSSDQIDDIKDRMQQIKDLSSQKPCESDDQTTALDHASSLMDTLKTHFSVLMNPTDATEHPIRPDTGGYKYQGGTASFFGQEAGFTVGAATPVQGYYGSNGAYYGGNGYYYYPAYQYPQNWYGQYNGQYNGQSSGNSNRAPPAPQYQAPQAQPYYVAPAPVSPGNTPPTLNDKNGDFILRFTEKVIETVLYQLEVIGGVFSSQNNSKSLSLVSELESTAKHLVSGFIRKS